MSDGEGALHPKLRKLIGKTIAKRYRIDRLVGIGGMAAVFAAHHKGLKRDVAIKIMHPTLTQNAEISERFDREAHSASRLDHPNCVTVTDYGSTEDGMKYMVMQLLEGQELSKQLSKPLSALRAVEYSLQIARGLDHAHGHGVVHRDIKPENIFITRNREGRESLKLVDFGIAKLVSGPDEKGHKTRAGLVFGTPAYMSPEQAAGLEADERADIYSAGIILYQMVAGRIPFDHDDPVSLVRMQVSTDPPPLQPSVPPVLAACVERMLAKAREDRFQSAAEVIETLEAILPMLDPSMPIILDRSTSAAYVLHTVAPTGSTEIPHLPQYPTHPPQQSPWIRDRKFVLGSLFVIAMLLLWIAWPDDKGDVDAATVAGQGGGADESAKPVKAHDLAEMDKLIQAGDLKAAEAILKDLQDEDHDNPVLLWRQGMILGKKRNSQRAALLAYGKAIDADRKLLEDAQFYAELHALMRLKALRAEALDLALRQMGDFGHQFLVEVVNDAKRPLEYVDRHRALEELEADPHQRNLVNRNLNMALDLLQAAGQSRTPCESYSEALEAIAAHPDYYFYSRVEKAQVPDPTQAEVPNPNDDLKCTGIVERRSDVLAMLSSLEPVEDDDVVVLEDAKEDATPKKTTKTPKKKTKKKNSKKKKKKPNCTGKFKKLNPKCK